MAETYTRDELDKMSRVQLRQTAVNCGMKHREATNTKSEDIKEFILGKGGDGESKGRGKGKAKDKGNGQSATAKPRGRGKGKGKAKDSGGDQSPPSDDSAELIHKVGLGMDENHQAVMNELEELKEATSTLTDAVAELEHQLFLISGLTADILKTQWDGPEEVNERLGELEEIWEKQCEDGDGEGEGDEGGNE